MAVNLGKFSHEQAEAIINAANDIVPSPNQQAIFDFITNGRGSAIVTAVAGSGKTTTIVMAASLIPAHLSAAFVAFNKSIATELAARLPQHVRSQTLNSMGFGAWRKMVSNPGALQIDANKVRGLVRSMLSPEDQGRYGQAVIKLVALAKSVGLVPKGLNPPPPISLTRDTDDAWMALMSKHGITFEEDEEGADEYGIALCRGILGRSIAMGRDVIDFDDQLYLPVIWGARFWQNDWLFVDEAQDVNMVQRAMLKRSLKPGGRLIAVGDPCQAIYGFRGADTDAIDNIKQEFGAIELPLSISYRCPQAVVREAQRHVRHIQPSPTAVEGKVDYLGNYGPDTFLPSDAIICRNTGPVVGLAFALIRERVACKVKGRDIGKGLIALVNKMNAKTMAELDTKLAAYLERECTKFISLGKEEQAEALTDRVDTIRVFMDMLREGQNSVADVIAEIEALFSDDVKGTLTLSTIHKAKGLEWERVFILDPGLMPSKWARQEWQKRQESNLQYVAVTRAKSELYYINSEQFKSRTPKKAKEQADVL